MRWLVLLCCCAVVGCSEDRETSTPTTAAPEASSPDEDDGGEDGGGACGSNAALDFGPTELPEALLGQPYEVDVRDHAEPGWWGGGGYAPQEPPPGLSWDEEGVVLSGVPTEAGAFELRVEAIHPTPEPGECGTHPDPHVFDLFVRVEPMVDTVTDGGGAGESGTGTSTGE